MLWVWVAGRAAHDDLVWSARTPGSTCAITTLAPKTHGLFTRQRLRRIYVRTARFATENGVHVGDTEEHVLNSYPGMLERVAQKYTPNQVDLILHKGDREIIFTFAHGRVSGISTGSRPEIDLVEGCS